MTDDHQHWITGFVHHQSEQAENLHNHCQHGSSKIAVHISTTISQAVKCNPTLTPSEIQIGKGIGFVPAAVDDASSHLGKISTVISRTKKMTPTCSQKWYVENFEHIAYEIDALIVNR